MSRPIRRTNLLAAALLAALGTYAVQAVEPAERVKTVIEIPGGEFGYFDNSDEPADLILVSTQPTVAAGGLLTPTEVPVFDEAKPGSTELRGSVKGPLTPGEVQKLALAREAVARAEATGTRAADTSHLNSARAFSETALKAKERKRMEQLAATKTEER